MTRYEFRQIVVDEISEEFAYSYLDRSMFLEGRSPMIRAWSKVADERWRLQEKFLKRHGVSMGHRMDPGAWRLQMAAE